jgi:hypothetical protein
MEDTKRVAEMLGAAMGDGNLNDEEDQLANVPAVPIHDPRFGTLDTQFHGLLSRLLGRRVWQRSEFDSMARELRLMPAGALDAVNSWSYERFDDPILVEDGDELKVEFNLLDNQT